MRLESAAARVLAKLRSARVPFRWWQRGYCSAQSARHQRECAPVLVACPVRARRGGGRHCSNPPAFRPAYHDPRAASRSGPAAFAGCCGRTRMDRRALRVRRVFVTPRLAHRPICRHAGVVPGDRGAARSCGIPRDKCARPRHNRGVRRRQSALSEREPGPIRSLPLTPGHPTNIGYRREPETRQLVRDRNLLGSAART